MNVPVARCITAGAACLLVVAAGLAGTVAQAAIAARAAGPGQYPVKAKVSLAQGEPWSVAADGRSGRVYVTNLFDQSVSVISTVTDAVVATTTVGENPRSVAVDPDTSRVYVANSGSHDISVLAARSGKVLTTIGLGDSVEPWAIAVDPVTDRIYVAEETTLYHQGQLQEIDPATGQVTATVNFPDNGVSTLMSGIAVNPRTATVYVTLWAANLTDIAVISEHTNQMVKKIKVPRNGFLDDIAVNTWTNQVYVTSRAPHTVIVINGATNDYARSFPTCPGPDGIAVNARDHAMYVTCYYDDDLSVLDTATGRQQATIPTGTKPYDDAYTGNAIYEINSGTEDLWVISTPR
jgi:YVTN family beta-propeller protein